MVDVGVGASVLLLFSVLCEMSSARESSHDNDDEFSDVELNDIRWVDFKVSYEVG